MYGLSSFTYCVILTFYADNIDFETEDISFSEYTQCAITAHDVTINSPAFQKPINTFC